MDIYLELKKNQQKYVATISLAQTEYYSNTGSYFTQGCDSTLPEKAFFRLGDDETGSVNSPDMRLFFLCIWRWHFLETD